ncbi:hypothetical protein ACF0H5_011620 [Mactra antiquata]
MDLCCYCLNMVTFLFIVARGTQKVKSHKIRLDNITLKAGPKNYEGLVEITSGSKHYNLCADEEKWYTSITNSTCARLDSRSGTSTTVYEDNVFNANSTRRVILKPQACTGNARGTCDAELVQNCTKLISMCCSREKSPIHTKPCSANWKNATSRGFHYLTIIPSIEQLLVYAASNEVDKEEQLSWIKYAFKVDDRNCEENVTLTNENKDIFKLCANECLNEYLNDAGTRNGKDFGGGDTSCKCENYVTSTCSSVALNVTRQTEEQIVLCVAASIKDDILRLEALECSKYLPTLYLGRDSVATTTTRTHTDGDKHNSSNNENDNNDGNENDNNDNGNDNDDGNDNENKKGNDHGNDYDDSGNGNSASIDMEKPGVILVIILVTVGILVCASVVIMLIKYSSKTQQSNRPVDNSRYFKNAGGKGDDHEEYVLINEMEMNSSVSEIRKPTLPKRGNNSDQDTNRYSQVQVIAADDYSTPKDSLKQCETDLMDVYSNTYDDPIRLGLKRETNDKTGNVPSLVKISKSKNNGKVVGKIENNENGEVETDKSDEKNTDKITDKNVAVYDNEVENEKVFMENNAVDTTDVKENNSHKSTDVKEKQSDRSSNISSNNNVNTSLSTL